MKTVLMISQNAISPNTISEKPLAGTQSVFIELSRALAEQGCKVYVRSAMNEQYTEANLEWAPLHNKDLPDHIDLMIVNVSPSLFDQFREVKAVTKLLWIHNEAKYLFYWKRMKYILRHMPVIVFSGKYHRSTYPRMLPSSGRKVIPYGLSPILKQFDFVPVEDKEKKVVFTSNPLRSLRWLVDIWVKYIHPEEPTATLHVFSGSKTYGEWGHQVGNRMQEELDYTMQFHNKGIILRDPLPKKELFEEVRTSRAMFYRGDRAETFCLAVAEAQSLGLPCVVTDLGSMSERVIHGETGFVAKNDEEFVRYALRILSDDELCTSMGKNALNKAKEYTWERSAALFLSIE